MAMQVSPKFDETWRRLLEMRGDPRVEIRRLTLALEWKQRGDECDEDEPQKVPPRPRLIGGTTLFMR